VFLRLRINDIELSHVEIPFLRKPLKASSDEARVRLQLAEHWTNVVEVLRFRAAQPEPLNIYEAPDAAPGSTSQEGSQRGRPLLIGELHGAGVALSAPKRISPGGWVLRVFLVLFAISFVMSLLGWLPKDQTEAAKSSGTAESGTTMVQANAPAPKNQIGPAPADPFSLLSSGQHLAEAKKALSEAKPHKDPMQRTWGRLGDAENHLDAIKPEDKEAKEAARLRKEIAVRRADAEKVSQMAVRELYAKELERNYLKNGLDVHITLGGTYKTNMTMKFVLFSRPLVYNLVNSDEFMSPVREAGFKKVTFTDGYRDSWSIEVK
jgi:hypothetical protein